MSLNTVYAYFTASSTAPAKVTHTGSIDVTFDVDDASSIVATTETGTTKIIPGDTLTLSGTVTNVGTADAYVILAYAIKIQKVGAQGYETLAQNHLTFNAENNLVEITGTTGNYPNLATLIKTTENDNSKSFASTNAITYKFDAQTYDNSFQNAKIKYEISAYAIQTAHITQADATDMLLKTAGYYDNKIVGNGVQASTPSPTSPVEIQSVGNKITNLLGYNDSVDKVILNSVSVKSVGNGTYSIKSSGNNSGGYLTIDIPEVVIEPNTTYYLHFRNFNNPANTSFGRNFELRNGDAKVIQFCNINDFHYENATFTAQSEVAESVVCNQIYMWLGSEETDIFDFTIQPSIDFQAKTIDYEMYGKYEITKSFSKSNLLGYNAEVDEEILNNVSVKSIGNGSYSIKSGGNNTGGNVVIPIPEIIIEPNTTYYLHFRNVNGESNTAYFRNFELRDNLNNRIISFLNATNTKENIIVPAQSLMTEAVACSQIYMWLGSSANIYDFTMQPSISLVEAEEYERYISPINIYLDEPLRKVGNAADYVDLETGTLVRCVGEYVFTGDETWVLENSSAEFIECYTQALRDVKANGVDVLSNRLPMGTYFTEPINSMWGRDNNKAISITIALEYVEAASAEGMKNLIAAWYENGNPLVVQFILESPIVEKINVIS